VIDGDFHRTDATTRLWRQSHNINMSSCSCPIDASSLPSGEKARRAYAKGVAADGIVRLFQCCWEKEGGT